VDDFNKFRAGEVEEHFALSALRFKHPCEVLVCLDPHRGIELVK